MNNLAIRNIFHSKKIIGFLSITLVIVLIGGLIWLQSTPNSTNPVTFRNSRAANVNAPRANRLNSTDVAPVVTVQPSTATNTPTANALQYIIEEEKLAHDVYEALYQLWGARVFSNIAGSETRHQSEILAILQSRQIADSRSSVAGKFTNQDLQKLYNTLVAQGSQDITEAYKVGKAIEELDIADITSAMNTLGTNDSDIQAMYQTLINGSKNHLSAFNRQLTR